MTFHPHSIRRVFATLLTGLLLATGFGRLSEAQPPVKNDGAAKTPFDTRTARTEGCGRWR
jgi:hypothetical protein